MTVILIASPVAAKTARNVLVGYVANDLLWFFDQPRFTSICMRVSAGARGPCRNGGNIHVHTEIPIITFPPPITISHHESIPLAPLEIRDAVFQELIRMSEEDEK